MLFDQTLGNGPLLPVLLVLVMGCCQPREPWVLPRLR